MPPERVMIKLALRQETVDAAKGERTFRAALDRACQRDLPRVESLLDKAGFVEEPDEELGHRLWPISNQTLQLLDAAAQRHAIPRAPLVRALINRMARAAE